MIEHELRVLAEKQKKLKRKMKENRERKKREKEEEERKEKEENVMLEKIREEEEFSIKPISNIVKKEYFKKNQKLLNFSSPLILEFNLCRDIVQSLKLFIPCYKMIIFREMLRHLYQVIIVIMPKFSNKKKNLKLRNETFTIMFKFQNSCCSKSCEKDA